MEQECWRPHRGLSGYGVEHASTYYFVICFLLFCSSTDPFADATKGDDLLPAGTEDYIHIRIQQRNGRKTLTTVQGIADDYDKKKLVKAFKKVTVRSGCMPELGPGELLCSPSESVTPL
jgi:hypothetical protein